MQTNEDGVIATAPESSPPTPDTTTNETNNSCCFSFLHRNTAEPRDSQESQESQESHQSHQSPTSCCMGWMNTIGLVINFYCCCPDN